MRTTTQAVKGIMLGEYDCLNNPDLTPFIESASLMIDDLVTCAATMSQTLSAAKLEIIERWLTAHLYQMADPGYIEKRTGKAMGKFTGETGFGLEASRFGSMVKRLDTTGCLSGLDAGASQVSLTWLGKPPSEQIEYTDRD